MSKECQIEDAQGIDGRRKSRRIYNPVPSVKRMLRTRLDGRRNLTELGLWQPPATHTGERR